MKTAAVFITLCIIMLSASISYTFASESYKQDIKYGNLERQKYDLYKPKVVDEKTPVLIFIYGGSWDSGEKSKYSFVGKTFSKEGFITAIPNYRLYPEVTFPDFVDDTALAFSAIKKRFPDRKIFIAGHSAGAQIGALLTYDKRYLKRHSLSPCKDITGFIGLAGPYDFEITEKKFKQIFPKSLRKQSQAIKYANHKSPSTLLLHGKSDTTVHAEDSELLANKLKNSGTDTTIKLYSGVGHVGIVAALAPLLSITAPTKKDMIEFMNLKVQKSTAC